MDMLCQRDVLGLGFAGNPTFSRTRWLPATMKGSSSVRRVGACSFCARTRPPRVLHCKVQLRRADRIVMAASMLWIADLAKAVVI